MYQLLDEGTGNKVILGNDIEASEKRVTISFKGNNNSVEISDGCQLPRLEVGITGDNNRVVIGRKSRINARLFCKGDSNKIIIGRLNGIVEGTLHAEYGTTISTGPDCMFSRGLIVRTGDSHSVIDIASQRRLNSPRSIAIGERVWCGYDVSIMKGVTIGPDTIVAACAVVTKSFPDGRSILAGIPAKLVQTGVFWDRRSLTENIDPAFMADALQVRGITPPPPLVEEPPPPTLTERTRQVLARVRPHASQIILYVLVLASLLLHLRLLLAT
jgi:acetyltransferase-like isoleucine patch superfamily enzyme